MALFDTSVLVAAESGRALTDRNDDYVVAVSVVTLAELTAGVLAAPRRRYAASAWPRCTR